MLSVLILSVTILIFAMVMRMLLELLKNVMNYIVCHVLSLL